MPWKNKLASLLSMELPVKIWSNTSDASATGHNELLNKDECLLVGNAQCYIMKCVIIGPPGGLVVAASTGMYYESAGREVQAAGSPGGSHAEGAEVSPVTQGR